MGGAADLLSHAFQGLTRNLLWRYAEARDQLKRSCSSLDRMGSKSNIRKTGKRASAGRGRILEQTRKERAQKRKAGKRLVIVWLVDSNGRPEPGERIVTHERRSEPAELANQARAKTIQPDQRDGSYGRNLAFWVAAGEKLDREIERARDALKRDADGLFVAWRQSIRGEHPIT